MIYVIIFFIIFFKFIFLKVNIYMTKHNVDQMVKSICAEFKVIVVVDKDFTENYGECYPEQDKIVLGKKYSSANIKFAVFLHELGHILTIRRKGSRYLAASVF